jgi:hypothetical protein
MTMRESSNRKLLPPTQHRLCDIVQATLAATFTPARLLLSWADQPIIMPGFHVRTTGVSVVVRYVQSRDSALSVRRTCARRMIEQYRLALLATGWQVDVIDQFRRSPFLRCSAISNVMSS